MLIKQKLFIIAFIIMVMFCSCGGNTIYTEEFFALDTYITVTVDHKNGKALIGDIKNIIKDYESKLSSTNTNSQIYMLNKNKTATLDSDCIELLTKTFTACDKTKGNFDLTVLPAVKAWGFLSDSYKIPNEKEINELQSYIGYNQVKISGNTVSISEKAEIDLGGSAKGFIGDKCAEYLEKNGVKYAVISLGGNIRTVGEKPNNEKFTVGIEYPDTHDVFATISCDDINIITSGAYQRNFIGDDGNLYHHIIDPKTAKPAVSDLKSVTVISKDGTLADCYSTAIFVMGLEKGAEFAMNNALNVVLLTSDNKLYVSKEISDNITLTDKYNAIELNIIK